MAGEETCWVSSSESSSSCTHRPSRNPTLDFVAAPALAPAEVSVDQNLMAEYEAELRRVRPVSFHHTYFFIKHHLRLRPSHSPRTTKISERIVLHCNSSPVLLFSVTTPRLMIADPLRRIQYTTYFSLINRNCIFFSFL